MGLPGRLNIDQVNIGLMLLSCLVAYIIPFELVLLSYAFLGPAHYLTEISWLHDRNYFTDKKWIWAPLTVISLIIIALNWGKNSNVDAIYFLFGLSLSVAASFIFGRSIKVRMAIALGLMTGFYLVHMAYPPFVLALAILLPTFIHVYVFTGLFILTGAMKNHNKWSYASFAVFILCGLSFLFITPSMIMMSTEFIDRNLGFFDKLVDYIVSIVSFGGRVNPHTVLAFLSFAYTYHYLNWFSKTEIIKWHKIPKRRMAMIVAVYVASVGLYLVNFKWGLAALSFLSMTHVILEFPLNAMSIKMLGAPFFARRQTVTS